MSMFAGSPTGARGGLVPAGARAGFLAIILGLHALALFKLSTAIPVTPLPSIAIDFAPLPDVAPPPVATPDPAPAMVEPESPPPAVEPEPPPVAEPPPPEAVAPPPEPQPDPAPPPVKPMSVISASPGPFTTQPMIESDSEVVMWASRSSSAATVVITSKPCRAQDGQEMMVTPRWRRPSDLRISNPTLTSSTGSAERETRIVSPMPDHKRLPKPIADLTVPETRPPASVMPRWIGASVTSASCW